MVFEGKELGDIKIEDIQYLIDNQITEDISIEYKSQMWERNDNGTREMLRDVSSMANARGGHVILGIKEDDEGDGIPKEIIGITDSDKAIQQIMSVCLSCIEEKIIGLDVILIPFKKDRDVVITRIPRSTRIPHMITFKHLYQCWRRYGRQKNVMSIDEIRDACVKVESLRQDLESFIKARKKRVSRTTRTLLLISATPMIVKDEIVDIFDPGLRKLLEKPPKINRETKYDLECYGRHDVLRPTLYGIKAEKKDLKSIEILRNGHIEFIALDLVVCNEPTNKKNTFNDQGIIEYLINFMLFLKRFLTYTSISEPVVISVALINAIDIGIFKYGIMGGMIHSFQEGEIRIWIEGEHLILPSMQVNSLDNPQKIAKKFADRIWNAFGFEKAPFYDDKGNFIPPK